MITHPLVAEAECTCYGCPDQWEGTLTDGRHFYLRYRHGWASLGIGADLRAAIEDPNRTGLAHGDGLQGIFESDESRAAIFSRLLAMHLVRDALREDAS